MAETWLTDCTAELVNITGYNFVSNHRKSKTVGGAGIYLQNHLEYKLLEECKFSDPDVIESLFLEIIAPHGKNIVVGCVYRPPNQNTAMFIDNWIYWQLIFTRLSSSHLQSNTPHLILCDANWQHIHQQPCPECF